MITEMNVYMKNKYVEQVPSGCHSEGRGGGSGFGEPMVETRERAFDEHSQSLGHPLQMIGDEAVHIVVGSKWPVVVAVAAAGQPKRLPLLPSCLQIEDYWFEASSSAAQAA